MMYGTKRVNDMWGCRNVLYDKYMCGKFIKNVWKFETVFFRPDKTTRPSERTILIPIILKMNHVSHPTVASSWFFVLILCYIRMMLFRIENGYCYGLKHLSGTASFQPNMKCRQKIHSLTITDFPILQKIFPNAKVLCALVPCIIDLIWKKL